MKKMKYIKLIIVIMLMMIPYNVRAYNMCSREDTVKLNKLVSNVLTNYSYYETNNGLKFKITINNLNSNIYIYDATKKQTYYSTGEITLDNYGPNQTIEYKIYSNVPYCKGQYLNSVFVTLPPYNPYYKDKLCLGIEDFKLCQRWSNVNLTYDQFKKEINDYLNSNKKEEIVNDEYKSIYEIILGIYIKYYYLILPAIIIIGGIVILINKQRNSKDEF